MTTGVLARPAAIDWRFVMRGAWFSFVAVGAAYLVVWSSWDASWSGRDLERYLSADYSAGYLYSPAFAALVSPLRLLPFPVALALWRIAEVAALVVVCRGTVLTWAVFLFPFLWNSELVVGNVMGFGAAAMIAVLRWPSVRSVGLYALLVALVPKPAFLPVLVWGFVAVPEARRWVIIAGAFGLVMLAWPGYIDGIAANEGALANWRWPLWVVVAGVGVALAGLRWSRLLGVAAVMVTPYVFPYALMPLATLWLDRRSS